MRFRYLVTYRALIAIEYPKGVAAFLAKER
jgi:hypothetical protein